MSAILSPTQTADKPKLLDQVRDVIRRKHFSIRTEQTYVEWIKRHILFHGKRHPNEMAEAEITVFLTHLARAGKVAASTQNQHEKASLTAGSGYKNSSMFYVYVLRSQADSGFYIGYNVQHPTPNASHVRGIAVGTRYVRSQPALCD